jgi:hypothetical protein
VNPRVRELLERYESELHALGIAPERVPDGVQGPSCALGHARWMVAKLLRDAEAEGWSERKVCRWLGFVQATMWAYGTTGIRRLRDDSRHLYPDPSPLSMTPAEFLALAWRYRTSDRWDVFHEQWFFGATGTAFLTPPGASVPEADARRVLHLLGEGESAG